ncbi:hypothetical protein LTR85_004262 [Meristemomyces frigidus]|nr:hypothetical protein LTR85_004262 [Meristemomyces frigidus]
MSVSSIENWLEEVENLPPESSFGGGLKRKRDLTAGPSKRVLLKRPMQDHTERQSRAGEPRARGRNVRRGRARNTVEATATPRRSKRSHATDDNDDLEVTPRAASSLHMATVPNLRPPSTSKSRGSLSSSARTRSSSPHKVSALSGLPEPIKIVKINPYEDNSLSSAVQELVTQVSEYAGGYGVLPAGLQSSLRAADLRNEFRRGDIFDGSGQRERLGEPLGLDLVDQICGDTRDCMERQQHEAAWNCESHVPIGREAWRRSSHRKTTRFDNITPADISPKTLLPSLTTGEPLESKRVDFAITLRPSDRMKEGFRVLEPLRGTIYKSWNQSTLHTIADSPLAVSIETKKAGENREKAEYQLSIWVHAQFKRLRILLQGSGRPEGTALPALPLIIVQGAQWEFFVATQDAQGDTVVWEHGSFGMADTRLGVYQIVAVLQYLIYWAQTEYRVWFEEYCLPQL